jgi:hypothetical protein
VTRSAPALAAGAFAYLATVCAMLAYVEEPIEVYPTQWRGFQGGWGRMAAYPDVLVADQKATDAFWSE